MQSETSHYSAVEAETPKFKRSHPPTAEHEASRRQKGATSQSSPSARLCRRTSRPARDHFAEPSNERADRSHRAGGTGSRLAFLTCAVGEGRRAAEQRRTAGWNGTDAMEPDIQFCSISIPRLGARPGLVIPISRSLACPSTSGEIFNFDFSPVATRFRSPRPSAGKQ